MTNERQPRRTTIRRRRTETHRQNATNYILINSCSES
jgi:hypothetical protein